MFIHCDAVTIIFIYTCTIKSLFIWTYTNPCLKMLFDVTKTSIGQIHHPDTSLSVNVANMFENFAEHTAGPVTTTFFMDGPALIGSADMIAHS